MEVFCPVCGLRMRNVARTHLAKHALTRAQFHALRLESEFGRPIADLLTDIYIVQRLETPEIFRRYGLAYRALREMLAAYNIPMRTRSEVVAATWAADDGSRAAATSAKMSETVKRLDLGGLNNPAKRPDVARKISVAKRRNNPGLMPMLLAQREYRLANPTPPEIRLMAALDAATIIYAREHQVARYFLDFALVAIKVAIECDGIGWHSANSDHDARRDAWLTAQGWRVFRYTNRQIRADAAGCIGDLITNLNRLGLNPPMRE